MSKQISTKQFILNSRVEQNSRQGFTLMEVMITLAIASVAMAAIYGVLFNMTASFTVQQANVEAQQLLRAASDLMIQDIRMGGYDPTGEGVDPDTTTDGNVGITVATAQSIQFTSDLDADRTIDDPNAGDGVDSTDFERMAYQYNNATDRVEQVLFKADGSEEDRTLLLDNVTAFSFSFLDENNTILGSPVAAVDLSRIRTVDLSMALSQPAGRAGSVARGITTRIKCRNMGLE